MARRNSEVELCFDSMTDLITNLAGGLILIVMLLLAITREAPKPLEPRPGSAGKQTSGEKSTLELSKRIFNLKIDTDRVDNEIIVDKQQLDELEKRAEELLKNTKAADSGAAASPPNKK